MGTDVESSLHFDFYIETVSSCICVHITFSTFTYFSVTILYLFSRPLYTIWVGCCKNLLLLKMKSNINSVSFSLRFFFGPNEYFSPRAPYNVTRPKLSSYTPLHGLRRRFLSNDPRPPSGLRATREVDPESEPLMDPIPST